MTNPHEPRDSSCTSYDQDTRNPQPVNTQGEPGKIDFSKKNTLFEFWHQLEEGITFLSGFLRSPKEVGSVVPSSRFLERRVVQMAQLDQADSVIELGPGTGGSTRAILRSMPKHGALMAVELDPYFVGMLSSRLKDPRLVIQHGCAEKLSEYLEQHNFPPPKAIISGIPFSTIPEEVGVGIISAIKEVLAPGGCFVAYQFRRAVADRARPIWGEPIACREFMNIPPMQVFRWCKD